MLMHFTLSIDAENLSERERAHIEDLTIDALSTAGLSIRGLKRTAPISDAAQLLDESSIPLAPQARQVLIDLISAALVLSSQEALRQTAAYLRDAMADVECFSTSLQTSDVRRLADEIDAIAKQERS